MPQLQEVTLYNGLSAEEIELVTMIAEEAGEVVKEAMKVLRHGWTDNGYDNKTKLEIELGDVIGLVRMTDERGYLSLLRVNAAADQKPAKAKPHMHHWKGKP